MLAELAGPLGLAVGWVRLAAELRRSSVSIVSAREEDQPGGRQAGGELLARPALDIQGATEYGDQQAEKISGLKRRTTTPSR